MPRRSIDRSPPQSRRSARPVASPGSRAAACLMWVFLYLVTAWIPETPAQTPAIIVEPEPGDGIEARQVGPNQIQLHMSRDRQTLRPNGTLGTVGLGDLSPLNPVAYVWSEIRIRIRVNRGPIPPYRLTASVVAPPSPTPGGIGNTDIGMGITQVRACNPVINPIFDYDPRNTPKDVDGIPLFPGSIGDLPVSGPGTTIYSSECTHARRVHSFRIIFAVAPQFFTPTGSVNLDLLLTLETP